MPFICCYYYIRRRCGGYEKQKPAHDVESPRVKSKPASKAKPSSKPPPLEPVSPSPKTSTSSNAPPVTPSTTSENLSHISTSAATSHFQHPGASLVFPSSMNSRYSGMRVGRTAWTSAYLPPPQSPVQSQRGLEHGASALEHRLDSCT